jgi:single-strand DNA-binding protein
MSDINAFTFTGRLGADAKVKTFPSGKSMMECSVANNTGYGDYAKTNWLKVKMYGDRVKNISQIFTKGALVGGTGELTTDTWEGKDGLQHTDIVVSVLNLQLLSKPRDSKPVDEEPEDYPEDTIF